MKHSCNLTSLAYSVSVGAFLLQRMFGWDTPTVQPIDKIDSLSVWCSCVILSYILECTASKELLLRIPLAFDAPEKEKPGI